jgi:hypothetical protein
MLGAGRQVGRHPSPTGDEWESEPKTRRLQMLAREVEAAR